MYFRLICTLRETRTTDLPTFFPTRRWMQYIYFGASRSVKHCTNLVQLVTNFNYYQGGTVPGTVPRWGVARYRTVWYRTTVDIAPLEDLAWYRIRINVAIAKVVSEPPFMKTSKAERASLSFSTPHFAYVAIFTHMTGRYRCRGQVRLSCNMCASFIERGGHEGHMMFQ